MRYAWIGVLARLLNIFFLIFTYKKLITLAMNSILENWHKARENFRKIELDPNFKQQLRLFKNSWHIIVPGQAFRFLYIDGEYIVPQFIRHHLSNTADGLMFASLTGMAIASAQAAKSDECKPRPILAGAFALAVLGGWEAIATLDPNRSGFDTVDMSLHVLSVSAYWAVTKFGFMKPKLPEQDTQPT